MDIVVIGRNVEVPDHYRKHVRGKLSRLERYDKKVFRYEVELFHEPNPRQSKSCQRVEITGKGKGPAIRAEACAGDFYAALDAAVNKLENRLRRMHDRRRVHYGRRCPESLAEATSAAVTAGSAMRAGRSSSTSTAVLEAPEAEPAGNPVDRADIDLPRQRWNEESATGHTPGRIVRERHHSAEPITVDQALHDMELVGHDFHLFNDAETGRPSVVYRRKGFDYGVIRLG